MTHSCSLILVLVRTFWEEGEVDEAIRIAREMERRGVIGSPSVYYELACCLCNKGRWQEAVMEVSLVVYFVVAHERGGSVAPYGQYSMLRFLVTL